MLITMILAMVAYGYTRGMDGGEISSSMSDAIKGVANVLLVIGAGGIMKQVIITSGVGATLADMVSLMPVSPLILAWVITVVLRLLTRPGYRLGHHRRRRRGAYGYAVWHQPGACSTGLRLRIQYHHAYV